MVMLGLAETYFAAFVLELRLGAVASGMILTLPVLLAAVLQLGTPTLVRVLGSYRKVVYLTAALQSVSLVPLMVIALRGESPAWLVFLLVTLYMCGAVMGGPAWSAWMGLMVPDKVRNAFFARRNRWLQTGNLCGMLMGGGLLWLSNVLDARAANGDEVWIRAREMLGVADLTMAAFVVIFGLALVSRMVSAIFLYRQSEPQPLPIREVTVSVGAFARRMVHGREGPLIAYILSFQFTLQMALPFWHPYALNHIGIEYHLYMALQASLMVGRMIALPWLARLAGRYGRRNVLMAAGALSVPSSLLWLMSDSFWMLLAAHLILGAIFAAYELTTFLLLLETIKPEERTSVLSKFTLLQNLAMTGGSGLGGWILSALGATGAAYAVIFTVSRTAKLATLPLLMRLAPGVRAEASAAERATLGTGPAMTLSETTGVERTLLPGSDEVASLSAVADEGKR
jgi:MFS family permease